jgi:hypothetical protein
MYKVTILIISQVYPDGIRHIGAKNTTWKVSDKKESDKKKIVRCAVNQRQIVIALQGGRLIYFEMHPVRTIALHFFYFPYPIGMKRWKDCVNQDLDEKNLSGHEVHNRAAWKRLTRNANPI